MVGMGEPARLRLRLTALLASALPFLQAALGLGEHPIQPGQFQAVLVQRCCLWAKPPVLPLLVLKGGADATAESGDFLGQPLGLQAGGVFVNPRFESSRDHNPQTVKN